jgi:adenosine kinase
LKELRECSHGFIFTDRDQNQFTAFYSGPAESREYESRFRNFVKLYSDSIDYAILAPDIARNMIGAAECLNQSSIPFISDPGQQVSDFTDEECKRLVHLSQFVIGNEFEVNRIRDAVPAIDDLIKGVIVTLGSRGVWWNIDGETACERAARPTRQFDPTGCGDAFRAGLVHALLSGASWQDSMRSGSIVASISMGYPGSQNHDLSSFGETYVREWDDRPAWLTKQTGSR